MQFCLGVCYTNCQQTDRHPKKMLCFILSFWYLLHSRSTWTYHGRSCECQGHFLPTSIKTQASSYDHPFPPSFDEELITGEPQRSAKDNSWGIGFLGLNLQKPRRALLIFFAHK